MPAHCLYLAQYLGAEAEVGGVFAVMADVVEAVELFVEPVVARVISRVPLWGWYDCSPCMSVWWW